MDGNIGAKRQPIVITTPLYDRFEDIAMQPDSYPAVDHIRTGYRRSVCGVDCIYYRIAVDGVVEIVAILGNQDTQEALF